MVEETPPAKPSADDNPYAQHYVVKKGDTLSKIAEQFYGDPTLTRGSSTPIATCSSTPTGSSRASGCIP